MSKTLYIGIDVSKCKLDTSTTINSNTILAFSTFENKLLSFRKLFKWVDNQRKKLKLENMHFCIESTGIYSEEIVEYLQAQKHAIVSLINPAQAKFFANSRLLRTKNDKVDSSMLASYCFINRPKETPRASEEMKLLKKLVRYEDYLIDQRAQIKTKLSSVKDTDIGNSINKLIAIYTEQIDLIENELINCVNKNEHLNNSIKLLSSINCIGMKTACRILVELIQEENLTLTAKSQVAHAGLAPKHRESGSSVRGKPRICKTGNSRLRKYLYMPTIGAIINNPLIKTFYDILISKGKHKMVALTACMKKFLSIAVGVLRNQKPFDVNWSTNVQIEYLNAA